MKASELSALCTALSFTVVEARTAPSALPDADQFSALSDIIEAFCMHGLPVSRPVCEPHAANDDRKPPYAAPWTIASPNLDHTIEEIKRGLHQDGSADMHYDRPSLLALYDRLHQRYTAYADDAMLSDRVLELLDAELAQVTQPLSGA